MYKQKSFAKVINFIMLSALIYLAILLCQCISNEQEMIEKSINEKLQIQTKEFSDYNILKHLKQDKINVPIIRKKSSFNPNVILVNGSFAILLAGFINWTNILFTGTI